MLYPGQHCKVPSLREVDLYFFFWHKVNLLIKLHGMQAGPLHSWGCDLHRNDGALTHGISRRFLQEKHCHRQGVMFTEAWSYDFWVILA